MLFFTIIVMEILAGAEIDLFIPSFLEIQNTFMLSITEVELMLIANCIPYGISCLVVGNLGDKYGTRFVIILSLVIFALGSMFCVFAIDYIHILIGRVLQGLGTAGPAVLVFVVLAERYPVKDQQKLMGLLIGTSTMAMAFAPVCGSYINLYFGWRGNFTILLFIGLCSLCMATMHLPKATTYAHIQVSIKEYLPLLRSQRSLYYILSICFLCVPYWIFVGISSILYMRDMNVSLLMFGYYQGALSFVFALFSLYSAKLIDYFGARRCFYFGLWTSIISVILIVVLGALELKNPLLITLTLMVASCGAVFPINILYPISMTISGDAKGRMASSIQALRLMMTAVGLQLASYFYDGTFLKIAIILGTTQALGLYGAWMIDRRKYINWLI